MATFRVAPKDLGRVIRQKGSGAVPAMMTGMRIGAQRGITQLVKATDDAGITDQGQYKNAWSKAIPQRVGKAITITNDAPYAGIIERGARPHAVSKAGLQAITEWAERKLKLDPKDAKAVAWSVAKKLKEQGQKPRWLVKNQLPKLSRFSGEEIMRAFAAWMAKPPGGV